MKPHYSQDEANDILRRAVERMPMRDEMSREQLEMVAAELGIPQDALTRAEADWRAEQTDKAELTAYASAKRLSFYKHFVAYVLCMLMFVVLGVTEGDGPMPALVIGLLWGIGIACHALNAFNTTGDRFQAGFAQWRLERKALEATARELGRIPPDSREQR